MKTYYVALLLETKTSGEYALPLFALSKDEKSDEGVKNAVKELASFTSEEITAISVRTGVTLVTNESIDSIEEEISALTARYPTAFLKLIQFVDEDLPWKDGKILKEIRAKLDTSKHTLYLIKGGEETKAQGEWFTITLNNHFPGIIFVEAVKPKREES
jgi:hypothetical protein